MKRHLITVLLVLGLIGFVSLGIANITKTNHKLKTQDVQLQSKSADLQLLEIKFKKLNVDLEKEQTSKDHNQQKIEELQKQKKDLQNDLEDAERQLQTRAIQREAARKRIAQAASLTATASAAGGNFYKNFIYSHESGNVPCKINGGAINCYYTGSRACGLGQALPCSKLRAVCPNLADYACQDAWWTNVYMKGRYGTWANAYAFWIAHRWW